MRRLIAAVDDENTAPRDPVAVAAVGNEDTAPRDPVAAPVVTDAAPMDADAAPTGRVLRSRSSPPKTPVKGQKRAAGDALSGPSKRHTRSVLVDLFQDALNEQEGEWRGRR